MSGSKGLGLDSSKDAELSPLLLAAQEGNKDAYERFLGEVCVLLRSFLVKRMGENETVDDVLQDSLLAIHRVRHTYVRGRPVGPWLYAICEHRMTDFYRKRRRLEKIESPVSGDIERFAKTAEQNTGMEKGEQVRSLLEHLPEKQRKVIELLKIHDLSVKEVSARTGMSESAVKVTAFRGYEAIRRLFRMGGK
ncbi:MAG: sigma-70 family RNA polymerase sigma factor [Deltaproteobacteria bacterium]|nr:sigma-70 family RNA polymerase sigma factor [Deltaproteobacteria bacterium]